MKTIFNYQRFLILSMFLVSSLVVIAQSINNTAKCHEISFYDYRKSDNYRDSLLRQIYGKQNKLILYGGIIHRTDSIKFYSANREIYASEINNIAVRTDGESFLTELQVDKEKTQNLTMCLDDCHYQINIPPKTTRVFVNRMTPTINVIFY